MAKQRHSKARTARSKNPPRGGPGILVISETGREIKCQREALEIIRHYFYKQQGVHAPSSALANDPPNHNHQQKEGTNLNESKEVASSNVNVCLSLEEEIAMLQKGASADAVLAGSSDSKSKAPFRVYDTGCKGTVFIMCTIPNCELMETTISTAKAKHVDDANNDACEDTADKDVGDKIDGGMDKDKNESPQDSDVNETSSTMKRKQDGEVLTTSTDLPSDNIQLKAKKQKRDGDSAGNETDEKKWDPITTVQSIFKDIREQNTEAPRSRFVNRMVPMQATCFASMEEIEVNVRELIKSFLLPRGIDHAHQREHDKNIADDKGDDNLPSFKIEFKHRNCTHIRRDLVVESIAGIIQDLTKEYWNNVCKDGASSEETMEEKKKELFRVDLTNPQYTIIIEICRTLCGMSVVSSATSFKKFNLLMAQEEVDATNGNGAKDVK